MVLLSKIGYCATKFIIQIPNDAGRIRGISDIETFCELLNTHNDFNYDFELYVK